MTLAKICLVLNVAFAVMNAIFVYTLHSPVNLVIGLGNAFVAGLFTDIVMNNRWDDECLP